MRMYNSLMKILNGKKEIPPIYIWGRLQFPPLNFKTEEFSPSCIVN